jgi:ParB/RepB/Spo0J family partition protein
MAKMGSGTGLRKIALSQIVSTGNVRVDYSDIEELAESIKLVGQLEPILVKPLEPKDGIEQFEVVAGHRRLMAFQNLCEWGENFTNIDAIVVTGDKLTIQLVENLQRSDLSATERESGIYQMCKNGLSQKEVAARLSKTAEYISRNVSAYKIREAAQKAKIDTSELATSTLNEIQAAAAADYPALVKEILQNGGTLEAARGVMESYNVAHGKPANPRKAKSKESGGISDPLKLHPSPIIDPVVEELSESGVDVNIDIDTSATNAEPPPSAKQAPKPETKKSGASSRSWLDDFDPPHKQVDFNNVCLLIMKYGKRFDDTIIACEKHDCDLCRDKCIEYSVREAIRDILALLHSEL